MRILFTATFALAVAGALVPAVAFDAPVDDSAEPMATGRFEPAWESLEQYETPEWFRDAKFGIWAHWGPQCAPEAGDWYARHMYHEGSGQQRSHLEHYGHPSQMGFKDVIHGWRADKWDPDKLMDLYQRAGARYFVAMANHHDNFDNFDSRHQPWNAVRLGPKKDLIAGWAKAARGRGLRFGVSVHAAHAWTWYEPSQLADRQGPLRGVPYDGRLTAADGAGQWWEGLDPQDLYAQNHPLSVQSDNPSGIHSQWTWGNGATTPSVAYCTKFYNRTIDLINQHHPDLLYFDDTALPLWPVSDAGLKIAAHYYNDSERRHGGRLEAVLNGKVLDERQRRCMVWDIERGQSNQIEPLPWQTDTCIGGWHYDRGLYDRRGYKSAKDVVHALVDIVSKNGNLLLSVPVRSDGSIDELEVEVVEGIAAWMAVHGQSIYGTRPWRVFGEGPALADVAPIRAQGFNEGRGRPLGPTDARYVQKPGEKALYVTLFGAPTGATSLKALGLGAGPERIAAVELLGSDETVRWTQGEDGLTIEPAPEYPSELAVVYRVTLK